MSLEKFTNAYLHCILWAETDDNDKPLDATYDIESFAQQSLETIKKECAGFYYANAHLILADNPRGMSDAGGDDKFSAAGHDFWLTRAGHGAGFWDGDWPVNGDALTDAAKAHKPCDVYVGDDGALYVE